MVLSAHASYPQSQTYVLKLHRDAAPAEGRIVGRLEHIASATQFTFNSAAELIDCLIRSAAVTSEPADDAVEGSTP